MADAEEVNFSLKVMINKENTKVLYAEADGQFVDVLLSFLTLPLGRIVKVLGKHYADEAPIIGCLTTLYNSVVNLDSSHFSTEGVKFILLNPTSTFDCDCRSLKLNISESDPEHFLCEMCSIIYYYQTTSCRHCGHGTVKKVAAEEFSFGSSDGVFTFDAATFIITDDLKIMPKPNEIGFAQTISDLGITGTYNAELINVTFGLNEVMHLLKASMISQTPLSDLLSVKARRLNSTEVESESETSVNQTEREENPNSEKMMLKVFVQKSTNRLLFAQAKKGFINFVFSLLTIPLGGVECLLASRTCIKSIDNLYWSVFHLIDDEYFKFLTLSEKHLPDFYQQEWVISLINDPRVQGNYIKGPRTYQVLDDLTVTPFYTSSILYSINQLMIPVSDVKELEIEIGLEEALSILKASLTSNSALTNGLMNHISNAQPMPEI